MEYFEYIIIGDTEKYNDCLVAICGNVTEAKANAILDRMLNNPTEHDKKKMERHTNFRIKKVAGKDCWWNDPVMCN